MIQDIDKLWDYLSNKTGISTTYKKYYKKPPKHAFYAKIDGIEYELRRNHIKGQADWVFMSPNLFDKVQFNKDIVFDEIYNNVRRPLKDFNVNIVIKKNAYKNCQGGGWYCMEDIYEIDGFQFANMS